MINDYGTNNAQYKTISILGQCCQGIGIVHLAKHIPTGQMVAIKRINMDKVKEEAGLIEHEIILTRQLKHPNIIKYLVAYVSGSEVCVVSPLMGYGSCRDLLNTHFNEGLSENAIAIIVRDVLDALDYVHKRGIIHRAIRASHVLVSANGHTSLSGFRYSCPIVKHGKWQRQIHSFPASTIKNLNWLSPELLEQNLQGYNQKSDIYSVGMLICELANGSEPFAGTSTTLMLTEKVRGSVPPLLDCSTLPMEEVDSHGKSVCLFIVVKFNQEKLLKISFFNLIIGTWKLIDCIFKLFWKMIYKNYAGRKISKLPRYLCSGDSGLKLAFKNQASRKFSDALHEVNALCLQRDAYDRPTAAQLLMHSFFKVNRRSMQLPELLKPAIPFNDNVACNTDELQSFESSQMLSDLELSSCDWDF